MPRRVKSCIYNNLKPAKVNVIDPYKNNFTQPLNIKEILDELEISKDDYYRTLSIQQDEDLQLDLKSHPNFSALLTIILMLVCELDRQIWTYSLFLISI